MRLQIKGTGMMAWWYVKKRPGQSRFSGREMKRGRRAKGEGRKGWKRRKRKRRFQTRPRVLMGAGEEGFLPHDQWLGRGCMARAMGMLSIAFCLGVKSPLFISFPFHHPPPSTINCKSLRPQNPPVFPPQILWQPSFQRPRKLRQTTGGRVVLAKSFVMTTISASCTGSSSPPMA